MNDSGTSIVRRAVTAGVALVAVGPVGWFALGILATQLRTVAPVEILGVPLLTVAEGQVLFQYDVVHLLGVPLLLIGTVVAAGCVVLGVGAILLGVAVAFVSDVARHRRAGDRWDSLPDHGPFRPVDGDGPLPDYETRIDDRRVLLESRADGDHQGIVVRTPLRTVARGTGFEVQATCDGGARGTLAWLIGRCGSGDLRDVPVHVRPSVETLFDADDGEGGAAISVDDTVGVVEYRIHTFDVEPNRLVAIAESVVEITRAVEETAEQRSDAATSDRQTDTARADAGLSATE